MKINNLETFKAKVESGQLCLGMVISLADPVVSELAGDLGWDFTWIDMEHGPLTIQNALGHVMALRGTDAASFVRVPANDPVLIKPVLELAPAGVIIPMVNTAQQAIDAVKACKYPPKGIRGCGPKRATFSAPSFNDYLKTSEHDPMVIIQIEHIDAVNNLDDIIDVEGIDSICVGPCDLSASMGKLDQLGCQEVETVIDEICARAKAKGMMVGAATGGDSETIERWRKRGASWLAMGSDIGCISASSKDILARR